MAAIFWMFGTLISLSLMAIFARELSADIPTHETLFFRSAVGLICVSVVMLVSKIRTKTKFDIKSNRLSTHFLRNIFHFGGQYGWFLGISLLPLAEVFALEFTIPIWTLIIAAIALNEKITKEKIISILFGMIGVLVILQPGVAIIDTASFIVLGAAICYAITHSFTKSLSNTESPINILFYMCLIQLPIGLLLSINNWVSPTYMQLLFLIGVGVTALSSHYCLVKAMQGAEVTAIVTLDFLRLPLIAFIGVFMYAEEFNMAIIFGGTLMLLGNLVSLRNTVKNK